MAQAKHITYQAAIKLLSGFADEIVRELRSSNLQDIMLAGVTNTAKTKLPERALQAAARIKELKSKASGVLLQFSGRPAEQFFICAHLLSQTRMPDDKKICLNYFLRNRTDISGESAPCEAAIGSLAGFVNEARKPGADLNAALKKNREDYFKAGIRSDWWINTVDRAIFTKREWQSVLAALAATMCDDGLIAECRQMRKDIKPPNRDNMAGVLQQEVYRDWRNALRAEISERHKQCRKDIFTKLADHDKWGNLQSNLALQICLGRIDPVQGQKHTDSVYTHTDAITKVREWELISQTDERIETMYRSIPPCDQLKAESRHVKGVFAVRESLLRGVKAAKMNNGQILRKKWPPAMQPSMQKPGDKKRGLLSFLPGTALRRGRARAA